MLVRKYGLGISIDVKLLISLIQFSHWSAKLIVDLLVSFVIASDFLIIFSSERDGMSFVEFHVSSRIFVAELHMHYFLVLCDLKRLN